jgi:hypothetical protein
MAGCGPRACSRPPSNIPLACWEAHRGGRSGGCLCWPVRDSWVSFRSRPIPRGGRFGRWFSGSAESVAQPSPGRPARCVAVSAPVRHQCRLWCLRWCPCPYRLRWCCGACVWAFASHQTASSPAAATTRMSWSVITASPCSDGPGRSSPTWRAIARPWASAPRVRSALGQSRAACPRLTSVSP